MAKRIKLIANLGLVGCDVTDEMSLDELGIGSEEWDNMSEDEKSQTMNEVLEQFVWDRLDSWWEYCEEEKGNCYEFGN